MIIKTRNNHGRGPLVERAKRNPAFASAWEFIREVNKPMLQLTIEAPQGKEYVVSVTEYDIKLLMQAFRNWLEEFERE